MNENLIISTKEDNKSSPKDSKKEHTLLSYESKVYSFAVKFYDEQMPDGFDATIKAITETEKSYLQILLICHDKDEVTDGIWKVATLKRHYHMIVRQTDSTKRERIKKILDSLHVVFRQDIDDSLLINHGIETVNDFTNYAVYLTHDTKKAKEDGKANYDVSEIISNLTIDEIKQIRDGYTRLSESIEKVTPSKLAELDRDAFNLGKELKNFNSWYKAQPFSVRSNAKIKTIKESYDLGVETRFEENRKLNRLCIYIQGDPNTGKTYAAEKALAGKQILLLNGGGTGKFDRLRPDHEAIIVDDDICPNLLNMSDNYMCRAYRRNSNNPVWAGQYFIVTSNLSFTEWLVSCGIKVSKLATANYNMHQNKHYAAMLSRFFVCCLTQNNDAHNQLTLVSPSTRGSCTEQLERLNMFLEFQKNLTKP